MIGQSVVNGTVEAVVRTLLDAKRGGAPMPTGPWVLRPGLRWSGGRFRAVRARHRGGRVAAQPTPSTAG